ncbi:MAG: hypothetical protein JKY37_25255, partial [Nannocystaceae bacterium]|nr:hypothetical protein [Nannocystaceae bacterium]
PADSAAAYAHDDEGDAAQAPRVRPAPTQLDNLDDALAAVAAANPQGAIVFLQGHVQATPSDVAARLALSRALGYVGRFKDAAEVLADPKGSPEDPQVVIRRAVLAERLGAAADGLAWLQAASAKHPKNLPLQGELMWMLARTGKLDDPQAKALMEGLYDAFDAGAATSAAALLAIAQAALGRRSSGGFHDANMVLEDAEAAAPASAGTWISDRVLLVRGELFLQKYAETDAAQTFGLILARDAWHPDALVGMARVHMAGLRIGEATRFAGEALQVAPGHPGAHAVLAEIALIEGRRGEAKERLAKHVLATNPADRAGHAVLAAMAIFEHDAAAYDNSRDRVLAVNPSDGRFFAHISEILGFLHLYPESDVVLNEGMVAAPNNPYVLSALGLNQLRIGHEKKARASLAAAWERDEFNERTHNVLDLYNETIDKDYSDKAIGDLTVRLPNEDREFVQGALLSAVRGSRKELDDAYHIKTGDLRLEFYADPQAFSVRTVGVPSLGALAVCFGPVITFVGPYTGAYNMEMVVRHELAHTYAIKISQGRVPRWFTEGLSEWESELEDPAFARESAALLSGARSAGKLRRLSELELAFIRADSSLMMEVAYATAAYAMRYLGSTYGRDKLILILEGYGTGGETDALFSKHLGKDLATVEKDFERWFFGELDRKLCGWSPVVDGPGDARDEALRKAVALAGSGDNQAASRALQALVGGDGDGYAPRMMLAKLLLDGPKPAAAVRHLRAAAKFRSEDIEPLVLLANHARQQGNVANEKKLLLEALALDGDSLEPAARLLMLAHVTADPKALAIARRRVRAIAPLHPITLVDEALRLANAGELRAAKKWLDRGAGGLAQRGGPADTLVVATLAAKAVGDKSRAKRLSDAARAAPELPAAAKKLLVP